MNEFCRASVLRTLSRYVKNFDFSFICHRLNTNTDSRATSILVAERLYYPSRETYSFLKFAITELFPLYLVTLRIVTETL